MNIYVAIAKLLLEVTNKTMKYLGDKQLIDAGEAKAYAKQTQKSLEALHIAQDIRRASRTRNKSDRVLRREDIDT